jgi:hypothetical protein
VLQGNRHVLVLFWLWILFSGRSFYRRENASGLNLEASKLLPEHQCYTKSKVTEVGARETREA